jgi:hypothetical protein
MGSQNKTVREEQKTRAERNVQQRLAVLQGMGLDEKGIAKDAVLKALKAKVRQAAARLRAIGKSELRTEELARIKAEKAAAPKPQKGAAKKAAEPPPEVKPKKEKKKKEKPATS